MRRLITPDSGDDEAPAAPGRGKAVSRLLAEGHYVSDRNGRLYWYAGNHWRPLTDFETMVRIKEASGGKLTKRSHQADVAHELAIETFVEDLAWRRAAAHEVPCASGMLDVRTLEIRPHTPDDFLDSALPHDFDRNADCPVWLGCLDDWFGSADADGVTALQEFLGYVLTSGNNLKKAALLVGPGNAGKSIVIDIARMLIGADAVCVLPVSAMDDPVRLCVIEGKILNVVAEIGSAAIFRDAGFKALVAGDPVLINPKFERPFHYLPLAKHLVACNELPALTGRTDEIFDRFLIIPMTRPVPVDRQDPELRNKLSAELPGIFAWALRGAKALADASWRFTEPAGRQAVLNQWLDVSSPAWRFLRDYLVAAPGHVVPLSQVVERLRSDWGQGATTREVGKAARELGFEIRKARVDGSAGINCIADHHLRTRGGLPKGPDDPPPAS